MLQPLAKQKDIRLQFESSNPPVLAFMDKERVLRVLANLIGNAIKFSPKHSKVVVKVRSDQQFVNISVTDSGPGIPENKLGTIFSHFWQARKTAEQGAGIGLAVVKTIVEAHGGTVRANSHAGSGSTFTFSLPRRRPAGAQLKKPAPIRYTTNPRLSNDTFTEGPSL
jgi:two-component system sensor histidine kinase ResE